jgi:hypothetical protein
MPLELLAVSGVFKLPPAKENLPITGIAFPENNGEVE